FEDFSHINEGIIYGIVRDIKKDKIAIDCRGEVKSYDLEIIFTGISVGDYIRAYVKENKVFLIEKITKEFYEEIFKILNEIKKLR
ncbi:MAG: hypothetical protein QXY16_01295, partial [Nanopusillaceae archaeon]